MSDFGLEVVAAARGYIGTPYVNHFKPEDHCDGGNLTLTNCMERGMDVTGFDCSGVVVAALCDVIGLRPKDWPQDYRHLRQMEKLARADEERLGDVVCLEGVKPNGKPWKHMGIVSSELQIVHADAFSSLVTEGQVVGNVRLRLVIPISILASIAEHDQ